MVVGQTDRERKVPERCNGARGQNGAMSQRCPQIGHTRALSYASISPSLVSSASKSLLQAKFGWFRLRGLRNGSAGAECQRGGRGGGALWRSG